MFPDMRLHLLAEQEQVWKMGLIKQVGARSPSIWDLEFKIS